MAEVLPELPCRGWAAARAGKVCRGVGEVSAVQILSGHEGSLVSKEIPLVTALRGHRLWLCWDSLGHRRADMEQMGRAELQVE